MAQAGHLAPARASGPAAAERGVLLARWRTSAWAAYGLLGLLGVGSHFLVATQRQQDLGYDLFGLGAIAAILVGVRVYRPARRAAWLTLALGVTLEAAGDLTLSYGTGRAPRVLTERGPCGPRSGAAEGWPVGRSPVGIEGARPARGRPSG